MGHFNKRKINLRTVYIHGIDILHILLELRVFSIF